MLDMEMYWGEQYLLQAFLAFNPDFEVMFATRAVAEALAKLLPRLIPGAGRDTVALQLLDSPPTLTQPW